MKQPLVYSAEYVKKHFIAKDKFMQAIESVRMNYGGEDYQQALRDIEHETLNEVSYELRQKTT